mgnify:CR=1 FL=1
MRNSFSISFMAISSINWVSSTIKSLYRYFYFIFEEKGVFETGTEMTIDHIHTLMSSIRFYLRREIIYSIRIWIKRFFNRHMRQVAYFYNLQARAHHCSEEFFRFLFDLISWSNVIHNQKLVFEQFFKRIKEFLTFLMKLTSSEFKEKNL